MPESLGRASGERWGVLMNAAGKAKLEALRAAFHASTGRPFNHFYCPFLFRDEDVRLCRAHIVSSAFAGADRSWTIQRADVDAFYGSFFEADFVAIQERGKHRLLDIVRNSKLARLLRPRIVVDGREVQYYLPQGRVPQTHSEVSLEDGDRPKTRLALKLEPSEVLSSLQSKWEIGITKDLRLAALVSLLRSAHLTLFELMGYEYALSASGHFLGHDILGRFFLANAGRNKESVIKAAENHFPEFVNLVRPILKHPPNLKGTTTDRMMYVCKGNPKPWALLILVRAGKDMHAVLVPVLEEPEGAARFIGFLKEPAPRFEVQLAKFAGDRWDVSRDSTMFNWPLANFN